MMSELSIEIDGRVYAGRFEVDGSVVTVHSAYGTDSTQVGGLTALQVAEQDSRLNEESTRTNVPACDFPILSSTQLIDYCC
jgi:hypothetical protein